MVDAIRTLAKGKIVPDALVRQALGPPSRALPPAAAASLDPHAFYTGLQEDSQEHLLRVLKHLGEHGAPIETLRGKMEWVTTCPECGYESVKPEEFCESVVKMSGDDYGPVSLTDYFADFQKEERLGGDNAWLCPKCNKKVRATRRPYIVEMPKYWLFFLKRFRPHSSWKIKRRITAPDAFRVGEERWLLKGIIHHHGESVHLGHYTTTIAPDPHANPFEFFEINDDKVRPIDSMRGDASTPYVLLYAKTE